MRRWRLALLIMAGVLGAAAGTVLAIALNVATGGTARWFPTMERYSLWWTGGATAGVAGAGLLVWWAQRWYDQGLIRRKAVDDLHRVQVLQASPSTDRWQPVAELLDPQRRVVGFAGRSAELAMLLGWCTDEHAGRLRLVTGGGGIGKTRLALRLEETLSGEHWLCMWVRDSREGDAVRAARAVTSGPVLLIVDYAETRIGLEEMLFAAADDTGSRMRVLLLARQSGDWWAHLESAQRAVRSMVADANRHVDALRLSPGIDAGLTDLDVVRQAMPSFARELRITPPDPQLVVLTGDRESAPILDLHAAALIAVMASRQHQPDQMLEIDLDQVLSNLLGHERHYWRGRAAAMGILDGQDGLTLDQLGQIVATGSLLGASTQDEAINLLARIPHISPSVKLVQWLQELYPPGADDGWFGSLRPDRLAELHITRQLTKSHDLADACLRGLDMRQARRALTLLASAYGEFPEADYLLQLALIRSAQIISGVDSYLEILDNLRYILPRANLIFAEHHSRVPHQIDYYHGWRSKVTKAAWGPAYVEQAISIRRALASANPSVFRPWLARSLFEYSLWLSEIGQPAKALMINDEAIGILREYATADPRSFRSHLAEALYNHASLLAEAQKQNDALAAIDEATDIYRELAAADPERFRQEFAETLYNKSVLHYELRQPTDGLVAAQEAIGIYRRLVVDRPDKFNRDFAATLHLQSVLLFNLLRWFSGLSAAEEAVALYRELAETRPDEISPYIAMSLSNLADILGALGRTEEARKALDEAAERAARDGHILALPSIGPFSFSYELWCADA